MGKMNYDRFYDPDEELKKIKNKYNRENMTFTEEDEKYWRKFLADNKRDVKGIKDNIESIKDTAPELYEELMKILEGKRPETKKSENGKPEGRKPETKKQENRKSEGRKPEMKKQENGKPEGKRPETKKQENRRSEGRKPETKKQEDRRSEGKKTETKKQENRRSEGRKPETKKQENRRSEGKKSETKKQENGKPEGRKPETKKSENKTTEPKNTTTMNYTGIENEYIHSIQFQLDDWEIDKFLKLKRDLAITSDPEKKNKIRHEMAVILGKEKDEKYSQNSAPKKEDKKEAETKKDTTKKEEVKQEEASENETSTEPMTIEEIRTRYKEIQQQIDQEKAKGQMDEKLCQELYQEFCALKKQAEELGENLEKAEKKSDTEPNKPTDEHETNKAEENKPDDMQETHLTPKKEGIFKRFGNFIRSTFRRENIEDYEDIHEHNKRKAEEERQAEKDPFQVLTDEEKEQYEKDIQKNIAKDVQNIVKDEKKENVLEAE